MRQGGNYSTLLVYVCVCSHSTLATIDRLGLNEVPTSFKRYYLGFQFVDFTKRLGSKEYQYFFISTIDVKVVDDIYTTR